MGVTSEIIFTAERFSRCYLKYSFENQGSQLDLSFVLRSVESTK
jgi:hypothetical protein